MDRAKDRRDLKIAALSVCTTQCISGCSRKTSFSRACPSLLLGIWWWWTSCLSLRLSFLSLCVCRCRPLLLLLPTSAENEGRSTGGTQERQRTDLAPIFVRCWMCVRAVDSRVLHSTNPAYSSHTVSGADRSHRCSAGRNPQAVREGASHAHENGYGEVRFLPGWSLVHFSSGHGAPFLSLIQLKIARKGRSLYTLRKEGQAAA